MFSLLKLNSNTHQSMLTLGKNRGGFFYTKKLTFTYGGGYTRRKCMRNN